MDVATVLKQLEEPAAVTFQSTSNLVGHVRRAAKKIDTERVKAGKSPYERKLHLAPVPEVEKLRGMSISPWELLHMLARATTLAGHGSSRALAQHWNSLRYVTALQANHQRRMELSADGKNPRYHRKAVQAQDLGIAFGLATAHYILRHRHPDYRFDIVDAELALEAGWALQGAGSTARERTRLRPNYFLVGRKLGAPLRIASVDCKGSHGKVEAQHDQLAKSAALVETVVLGDVDGGVTPLPSLLLATAVAAKGGIETRLLDPDGGGILAVPGKSAPDLTGPADELNLLPLIHFTNSDGRQSARPGFSIPAERTEWLSRILARTAAAGLLTFAGDRDAARSLLTKRQQHRLGSSHSHASSGMRFDTGITLGGMSLVGTDHVFRLNGRRVEVFSGLVEHMHRHLAKHELNEHEAALPNTVATWKRKKAAIAKDWDGLVHMDSAGAVLAIRAQDTNHQQLY
ncbi:hypothetical protein HUO13_28310 [Saccharopolyspora erythraea]|uniref:hypothetical protein n=1 Tax=Saccharopolyspora erythraea TaxID=1836 RepID=UPI001BA5AF25|nr:hypothetical protein [Saccharopolyspora erythraea]QUH04178.1 hypothetical protein HUO13_28310 [Saccharopolyspora erythraea]